MCDKFPLAHTHSQVLNSGARTRKAHLTQPLNAAYPAAAKLIIWDERDNGRRRAVCKPAEEASLTEFLPDHNPNTSNACLVLLVRAEQKTPSLSGARGQMTKMHKRRAFSLFAVCYLWPLVDHLVRYLSKKHRRRSLICSAAMDLWRG
jgi:hypothetical protein